jgi:hypothetical protein
MCVVMGPGLPAPLGLKWRAPGPQSGAICIFAMGAVRIFGKSRGRRPHRRLEPMRQSTRTGDTSWRFSIVEKLESWHLRECLHNPSREIAHCWDIKARA